jgi:hypothetical protein
MTPRERIDLESGNGTAVRLPAEGTEPDQNPLTNDISHQPICIRRRHGEELRLSVSEYNGHNYADLRLYYLNVDEKWCPGKGITVPPTLWQEFFEAVLELDHRLRMDGLVADDAEEVANGEHG